MASPMVQVNVRVPPELHARLILTANKTHSTVTAVVNEALKSYFEQGGKGK